VAPPKYVLPEATVPLSPSTHLSAMHTRHKNTRRDSMLQHCDHAGCAAQERSTLFLHSITMIKSAISSKTANCHAMNDKQAETTEKKFVKRAH